MAKKNILLAGIAAYAFLFLLAALFFKERTVFIDMAFHTFYIIKDGTFAIQNFRFGAFFTQLFPLLSSKAELPLTTVTFLYSISFVIYYLLLFIVLLKWVKNEAFALILLLFNTVMVTHTFYWVQSELPQGIAFGLVYAAVVQRLALKDKLPDYGAALLGVLLYVTVFFHPLMILALLYLLVFLMLHHPQRKKFFIYNIAAAITIAGIKSVFFKTAYDSQSLQGLSNFLKLFPNYFNLQANKNLVRYLLNDYYFVLLLLGWAVYFYIKNRQFLKLALMLFSFGGYAMLVNVTSPSGGAQFYFENQYLLLSVIVIIPFVMDILPRIKTLRLARGVVAGMLLISMVRILFTHDVYTNRLNWNREFLTKTEKLADKKIIIPAEKMPGDTLLMTWGTSYEMWMLSTLERGASRSVITEETKGEFDWMMGNNKGFITKWGIFDYSSLNPKYFRFTDTSYYKKY